MSLPAFFFLFSALVIIVVYIAGGIAYKGGYQGARGVEMIPNLDFWKSLPGYVKVQTSNHVLSPLPGCSSPLPTYITSFTELRAATVNTKKSLTLTIVKKKETWKKWCFHAIHSSSLQYMCNWAIFDKVMKKLFGNRMFLQPLFFATWLLGFLSCRMAACSFEKSWQDWKAVTAVKRPMKNCSEQAESSN